MLPRQWLLWYNCRSAKALWSLSFVEHEDDTERGYVQGAAKEEEDPSQSPWQSCSYQERYYILSSWFAACFKFLLLLILPLTLFYEAALMKSFVAGKRVVKTSSFSKEMDANRVSSLLPLFVILFHQFISLLLVSSSFFSMIGSLLVY